MGTLLYDGSKKTPCQKLAIEHRHEKGMSVARYTHVDRCGVSETSSSKKSGSSIEVSSFKSMVSTPVEECWVDKVYELDWILDLPDRGMSYGNITVELFSRVMTKGFARCSGSSQIQCNLVLAEFRRAFGAVFRREVLGNTAVELFVRCFTATKPPLRDRKFMLLLAHKIVSIGVMPKFPNMYSLAIVILAVYYCNMAPSTAVLGFDGLREADIREMVSALPHSPLVVENLDTRYIWNVIVHTSLQD